MSDLWIILLGGNLIQVEKIGVDICISWPWIKPSDVIFFHCCFRRSYRLEGKEKKTKNKKRKWAIITFWPSIWLYWNMVTRNMEFSTIQSLWTQILQQNSIDPRVANYGSWDEDGWRSNSSVFSCLYLEKLCSRAKMFSTKNAAISKNDGSSVTRWCPSGFGTQWALG